MQATVISKLERLQKRLGDLNKVVIGFSGGIDSTLLLKIAVKTLGRDNVWAVTGNSESLLPEELDSCRDLAGEIGLRPENFIEIKTDELSNPDYRKNPIDRCFYCKSELFGRLNDIAYEIGASVLDGSNADDLGDWRPGLKAASELGVISPLAEAGIVKQDIREMAHDLGLPNWDKPALACLSSRIPYGSEVTEEKLNQVAEAERFLHSLGFGQLRVRHHDKMARIELLRDEIPRIFKGDLINLVVEKLKSIGFAYVTVDLRGYRSGSMNENLELDKKR